MSTDGGFSAEGKLEIGPSEQYFIFLDGDWLGQLLLDHFGLPSERGYTNLGRVRISVEMLKEPGTGEPAPS